MIIILICFLAQGQLDPPAPFFSVYLPSHQDSSPTNIALPISSGIWSPCLPMAVLGPV